MNSATLELDWFKGSQPNTQTQAADTKTEFREFIYMCKDLSLKVESEPVGEWTDNQVSLEIQKV